MKREIVEVNTDYTDENGVTFIDGYTADEEEPGEVLGYFINGEFYPTKPEYRSLLIVQEAIKDLK
jgi:hypothetical protein